MKRFVYETCCVDSTAEKINVMVDVATEVTYRAIQKNCQGLRAWAHQMGYATSRAEISRGELTLKRDWSLPYYRSRYAGQPCYYVEHSKIEYIWTRRLRREQDRLTPLSEREGERNG